MPVDNLVFLVKFQVWQTSVNFSWCLQSLLHSREKEKEKILLDVNINKQVVIMNVMPIEKSVGDPNIFCFPGRAYV